MLLSNVQLRKKQMFQSKIFLKIKLELNGNGLWSVITWTDLKIDQN